MSEARIPALLVERRRQRPLNCTLSGLEGGFRPFSWSAIPTCSFTRARGLTPRTMEVYRQVGLEPAIQRASFAGPDFAWTPVLADTLKRPGVSAPDEPHEDDGANASPCSFGPIDQDKLEVLVRDEARKLGGDLRFGTEMTGFEQDDSGVTAVITDRNTGQQQTVRADFMVAAYGVNSHIRQQLGITAEGPGTLFNTPWQSSRPI